MFPVVCFPVLPQTCNPNLLKLVTSQDLKPGRRKRQTQAHACTINSGNSGVVPHQESREPTLQRANTAAAYNCAIDLPSRTTSVALCTPSRWHSAVLVGVEGFSNRGCVTYNSLLLSKLPLIKKLLKSRVLNGCSSRGHKQQQQQPSSDLVPHTTKPKLGSPEKWRREERESGWWKREGVGVKGRIP